MEIEENPGQLDEALKRNITILLFWGGVNVLLWYINIGSGLDRDIEITLLLWIGLYGALVIGELMILLGFLSMLSFRPHVLLFGGLSLFLVGIWNLISKFVLIQALTQDNSYIIFFKEESLFWYVLGVMQIIWGISQIINYSKVRNHKATLQHSQFINWHFLLYSFESDYMQKPFYVPNEKGPMWSWGAFFMPELWFLWHEMWGVSGLICVFEGFIFSTVAFYIGFFYAIFLGALIARVFAAYWGHRIFYFRYGKWLTA